MTTTKSVLEMDSKEAKEFFLTHDSYCNLDLPQYFDFAPLLTAVDKALGNGQLSSHFLVPAGEKYPLKPSEFEGVCYTILHNKDGKYAWRPIKLIHPAIYVDLVKKITDPKNWAAIKLKFGEFQNYKRIECGSLPVKSTTKNKDKASQILHWWEKIEQKSLELSLDFDFVYRTDITDCYSQIYTHSVAWALHTKAVAQSSAGKKDKSLIGNIIDQSLQSMSSGQTNGIPQGSVLSDFIAEIVLAYADTLISEDILSAKLKGCLNDDYFILRYRDDYRIFVNNPLHGEEIFQIISKVLFGLGLKMNPYKTDSTNKVVKDAVKADKVSWNTKKQSEKNLQKHLLLIHDFAQSFPNSGSLAVALDRFFKRIVNRKTLGSNILPMMGIVADIAVHNPRCTPICSAILSKFFELIPNKFTRHRLLMRLMRKLQKAPNNGHAEIWLQRISLFIAKKGAAFNEKLCQHAACNPKVIWNSDWLKPKIKNIVDSHLLVDCSKIKAMKIKVETAEVSLFKWIYES